MHFLPKYGQKSENAVFLLYFNSNLYHQYVVWYLLHFDQIFENRSQRSKVKYRSSVGQIWHTIMIFKGKEPHGNKTDWSETFVRMKAIHLEINFRSVQFWNGHSYLLSIYSWYMASWYMALVSPFCAHVAVLLQTKHVIFDL